MRTSFSCRVSSCLISACSSRGRVRSWIGKSRRDTHSKSVAHLLARREQGTKAAEQTYNVTTRYKERADDHVGFGNNLISICFRRLGLLDSFTRHRHRLSCTIDALDRFSMDGACKSVSKSVLNESKYTAVLPNSAAPICLVASDLGPGLGAPETGALASLLTIEPVLGALGLAFVASDLSKGLGLALAVTGLVLAHEALDLAFVTLALWLAALGPEGEILLLPVVAVSIGSDSNAKLGGCKCTSRYVK